MALLPEPTTPTTWNLICSSIVLKLLPNSQGTLQAYGLCLEPASVGNLIHGPWPLFLGFLIPEQVETSFHTRARTHTHTYVMFTIRSLYLCLSACLPAQLAGWLPVCGPVCRFAFGNWVVACVLCVCSFLCVVSCSLARLLACLSVWLSPISIFSDEFACAYMYVYV